MNITTRTITYEVMQPETIKETIYFIFTLGGMIPGWCGIILFFTMLYLVQKIMVSCWCCCDHP